MFLFAALSVWIPLIFLSYFAGRKQFSLKVLFILVTAEAIGLAFLPLAVASFPAAPSYVFTLYDIVFLMALSTGFTLPIGAPAVLTAFAIGRKCFGPGFFFYLTVVEVISLIAVCMGLPTI